MHTLTESMAVFWQKQDELGQSDQNLSSSAIRLFTFMLTSARATTKLNPRFCVMAKGTLLQLLGDMTMSLQGIEDLLTELETAGFIRKTEDTSPWDKKNRMAGYHIYPNGGVRSLPDGFGVPNDSAIIPVDTESDT